MAESIFQKIGSRVSEAKDALFAKEKQGLAMNPQAFNARGTNQNIAATGLTNTSKLSFDQLRMVADVDTVIRICIDTIKTAICQAKWNILQKASEGHSYSTENVERLNTLFTYLNANGENLREFLAMVVEDLLVLDVGTFEKVYNLGGELIELNSIDAATIRPIYNVYGEFDPEKAFVQMIDGKVVAEFKRNELVFMMRNPQNSIKRFGYGRSVIEGILMTVQSALNADLYNARAFSKDNVPAGLLDLGDMTNEEAQKFMALWNASVINNTQKIKFAWGKGSTQSRFIDFGKSQKDMQYMKYIEWLSRLKLAAFGLTGMDANIIQDINRSTSETMIEISNSRGTQSIMRLVEDYFNREILMPMGIVDVEFSFAKDVSLNMKYKQAEIDRIYLDTGVISPSYVAKREGFDTDFSEGMDYYSEEEGEVEEGEVEEKSVDSSKRYFKPLYK